MNRKRIAAGFGWGVVATVIMSVVMIAGMSTGIAPMPKPVPVAIVERTVGKMDQRILMLLGAVSHLLYGGIFGAVAAAVFRPVTVWKGVAIGVALWLIMQVAWLPYVGWGLFGTAENTRIAIATLILHLVYGTALGWLIDRKAPTGTERS